jgi:cytochrome P450
MRIAAQTLLGGDIDSKEAQQVAQLMVDTFAMMGSPLVHLLRRDYPGLPYHRLLDRVAEFDRAIRAIVVHKRAQGMDTGDVLSMLLQARDAETGTTLTDDELLGHVGVLFVAGHETSANALSWTLLLLSQHPQLAADLLDELDQVLRGDAPTVEQLTQLPLLEQVIKESLRLIPPAPWNGRVTAQPTELGGYVLPVGTEVLVSIYETHHMPEVYSQPNVFLPRRWETISPTIYEYNPFSAGPRMCIGATFAMMEIKIILAMLLQRYRFESLPATINVGGLIVFHPAPGLPMIVQHRDRQFQRGVGGLQGTIRAVVELPA